MKTTEEKNLLLAELKAHQAADEFVRGTWLEPNGVKGCFYGCTMKTDSEPREKFSEKYDIDLWYCYLTERIFEGLPYGEFKNFPHDSIEIIPLNFDFNKVKSEWNKSMLLKQLDWITDESIRTTLTETAKLFDVTFNKIDKKAAWSAAESAWSAAESARSAAGLAAESARSAARSAWSAAESARSAAGLAARSAWSAAESAWSAAESAGLAAESAAGLAAESARSAAEQNHYMWMRDTLFEIIKKHS